MAQLKSGTQSSRVYPVPVWGLTGGIGAGKSEAARIFAAHGISVIDADTLARELASEGGRAAPAILQRFGTLDRGKLRQIVFADKKARMDLESILHPMIQAESLARIETIAKKRARPLKMATPAQNAPVIYEAALLVETGRDKAFDGLIVIDAAEDIRRNRLIARDHLSPELAEQIIRSQIAEEKRRMAATFVIDNSGSKTELETKIKALIDAQGWLT